MNEDILVLLLNEQQFLCQVVGEAVAVATRSSATGY